MPLHVPLEHLPLLQAPRVYQNTAQQGEVEIGAGEGMTQSHKRKCEARTTPGKKETTQNQQSISMRALENSLPLTLSSPAWEGKSFTPALDAVKAATSPDRNRSH